VERAATVATWVNIVLFGGLALTCMHVSKRGRRQAAWAAVSFGVLGALSLVVLVLPEDGLRGSQLVARAVLVALLVYPFALYRFAASFEAAPRRFDQIALGLTAGLVATTIVAPPFPLGGEARPVWVEVYAVLYVFDWVALSSVVARRLWQAGRALPSVARYRTRTLALGAAGLALAGLPGVVPEASRPAPVQVASLLLPPVSALLFVVGFRPPAWLRAVWRRSDHVALRRLELELIGSDDRERIVARVLPHAARLVGGADATFVEGISGGGDGSAIAVPLTAASGTIVVRAGPYTPVFGEDETEMFAALAAFVDLLLGRTALLEREREARTVAERSTRELETLVYGISHDLKSPIISLLGYLELLREDHGDALPEGSGHYLHRMESAALYMQDLIGDLLELSRIGRVNVDTEEVDLAVLLDDIADALGARFPQATVATGGLPVVVMNAARARQLFTNLLENAARHSGRDDVAIRVWGIVRDDGSAVVSVADDGIGIPAAYRQKAFGIFERLSVREQSSGTGIGLAVCRKIVEAAGGTIDLVDAPKGTHVRIVLPPEAVRAAAAPAATSLRPRERAQVMR
jgi:signal transduction histidine kinase